MRHVVRSTLILAVALSVTRTAQAQREPVRSVPGGGIAVPGWQGMPDEGSLADAKLTREGDVLHVVTGPAVTYWNAADTVSGDYTVKAVFTEPKFMNLNDHPHPYGIVIAGNGMGTARRSYLYCAAYGNGRFIVRGFGPQSFQMNGGEGEENAAVHRAAAPGRPVTQEIAMSVHGDTVQCAINGTVVARYPRAQLVGAGKLASTNGVYGIRFAHNTEGTVSGLTVTK